MDFAVRGNLSPNSSHKWIHKTDGQSFLLHRACQGFVAKLGSKHSLSRDARPTPVRTRWLWGALLQRTLKAKALVFSKNL